MRLLVIRTSAMGDVALTTPVLRAIREQYPDVEVVLLTRPLFRSFFISFEGLGLFFTDLKKRHKGFLGLIRLFLDLRRTGRFDKVIDLHDVLRSKILRFLFSLNGVPSFVIDKGRGEKRAIISGKTRTKLKHSVERYSAVFEKAGFPVTFTKGPWIIPSSEALLKVDSITGKMEGLKIGVAPFARHKLKIWPEANMVRLLTLITATHPASFFLFGGNEEKERLSDFQRKIEGSFNTNGLLNLDEEIAMMSRLDLMIAMDSSNMHMAALTGTKVISIWGGTDPVSGFGAWRQPDEYSVRIHVDELTCRPCTIYGKGECKRGDFACMNWLTPEIVLRKIEKILGNMAE
jgi:ADP-heptose:LPS heptosyltransferase